MITSAIFKAAHHLTRETRQAGDSYQANFAAALKIAYASVDQAMTKASDRAAWASEREGRVYKAGRGWTHGTVNIGVHKTANDYITVCLTDVMDEVVDAAAESRETAKKTVATQSATSRAKRAGGRYVELASVASANGLNHGKTWWCGEMDIQTKGALPEWEGDVICYVYA